MNTRKLLHLAGIALCTAAFRGCTGGPDVTPLATPPAAIPVVRVSIDNFSFAPVVVTVPVGAKVTWVNHDDVPHTVTATNKSFTSGALDTDEQFSRVFSKAGEYQYYCAVHPHMTGRVIVK